MAKQLAFEAFDLGWESGRRRKWFEFDSKRYWFRENAIDQGEILGWLYSAADGTRILVFDD